MKATITKKIRKDYAVGLDRDICDQLNLKPGDYVIITFEKQEKLNISEQKQESDSIITDSIG